ncbi:tyrosine-type recombinase/integrase [Yersinia ruckeri]|uniref:tyrosine-type recombinase/integrase n=1 Tax=Yersinia ruckeri TaxID=29486 RepID=UPI003D12929F
MILLITSVKNGPITQAIQPVQARGALETVRRLCQRINEVMVYAQNTGLIDAVPSVNIGKAFEKPQKRNMPSIRPDQLPQLMQTMRTANIILPTRCLFMWQLLTITRPAEAAEARWDEVDLEAREWKIPASRMKMNRDHTVPLSNEAMAVLEMIKPLSGNREFIFPSRIKPNQPMNSQTVNASLKRAGFGGVYSVLDFYLFRTLNEAREITERWLNEYNSERPHESLNNLTPEEYRLMAEKPEISKSTWN